MNLLTSYIVAEKGIFPSTKANGGRYKYEFVGEYIFSFDEGTKIFASKEEADQNCSSTQEAVPYSVAFEYISQCIHHDS